MGEMIPFPTPPADPGRLPPWPRVEGGPGLSRRLFRLIGYLVELAIVEHERRCHGAGGPSPWARMGQGR